jgi:hypothetical protein
MRITYEVYRDDTGGIDYICHPDPKDENYFEVYGEITSVIAEPDMLNMILNILRVSPTIKHIAEDLIKKNMLSPFYKEK